jgi:2-methylcitrate dehydratase PrpD
MIHRWPDTPDKVIFSRNRAEEMKMATARELNPSAHGRAATAAVVDRVRSIAADGLSDPIRQVAKKCILDWFAVTLAGADEPLSRN